MLALRGKYAVTLYEVLEAYVNRRENSLTVSIEELRVWLKVTDDKTSYNEWKAFKRRVIGPAVKEINKRGDEGGFFVTYEAIREGRAYGKIKFTITKSAARDDRDLLLQDKPRRGRAYTAARRAGSGDNYEPTDSVLEKLREVAPGWDSQFLLARFREWSKGKTCRKIRTAHSSIGPSGSAREKPQAAVRCHRGWLRSNFVARDGRERDHRPHHAEHLGISDDCFHCERSQVCRTDRVDRREDQRRFSTDNIGFTVDCR